MGFYADLGGNYSLGYHHDVDEKLLDACALVATYLKTRYVGKSYGGYDIYEDEKISIDVDTYVPNIGVSINVDGNWQIVLSYNYGGFAQVYRPGKWEHYVQVVLLPEAQKRQQEEERAQNEARQKEHNKKFSPIDDSSTFA